MDQSFAIETIVENYLPISIVRPGKDIQYKRILYYTTIHKTNEKKRATETSTVISFRKCSNFYIFLLVNIYCAVLHYNILH